MTTSAKPKTFAQAMVAAQAEMPAVEPDSTNPHFKSKFVSLGHLIAKTRPVLNKHGIAVTQYPSRDEDGTPTLVTVLLHESGERMESTAPLLLPKQDPQGQGSAITYMRRYALASALGISDQEDDDGNGAAAKDKPKAETNGKPSPEQQQAVAKLLAEIDKQKVSWDEQKLLLAAMGVSAPDEEPEDDYKVYGTLTLEQLRQAWKFVTSAEKAA